MKKGVAIITGAGGGMGLEITKAVAKEGYTVIMAGSNSEKNRTACETLKKETGGEIELIGLNLSEFQSIDNFVAEIRKRYESIRLLINNAGAMPPEPRETIEELEYCAGTNYLGHYILTHRLLALMPAGSRIVNTVSLTYKMGKITENFFKPAYPKFFNRFRPYSNSKLAFLYFSLDAAEKWKELGITVNCSDPGVVNTPIVKMYNKTIDWLSDTFFRPFIKTPLQGASTAIRLALDPELEGVTGQLHANQKNRKIPTRILSSPQRKLLRKLTQQIIEEKKITL